MFMSELRIFNEFKRLGLTDKDFCFLEDSFNAYDDFVPGIKFLMRKKGYIIGVSSDMREPQYVVCEDPKNTPKKFPFQSFLGGYITQNVENNDGFRNFYHVLIEHELAGQTMDENYPSENFDIVKDEDALKKNLLSNISMLDNCEVYLHETVFLDWLMKSSMDKEYEDLLKDIEVFAKESKSFNDSFRDLEIGKDKHIYCKRKILHVYQGDNLRVALVTPDSHYNDEDKVTILTFTPDDDAYNYIDEGRVYCGKLFLDDDFPLNISAREINLYGQPETPIKLTRNMFLNAPIEINEQLFEERINRIKDEKLLSKKEEENKEKLKKEGFFEKHGFKFTPSSIVFGNRVLSGVDVKEFYRVAKLDNEWGFDYSKIRSQFLLYCYKKMRKDFKLNIVVENKRVKVFKKINTDSASFYFNNVRIKEFDVKKLLFMIPDFKDQKDFSRYLRSLKNSRIEVVEALKNGLIINIHEDPEFDYDTRIDLPKTYLRVNLVKRGKDFFALINGEKFKITNIDNFITFTHRSHESSLYEIVDDMSRYIENIGPKEFSYIIKEENIRIKNEKIKEQKRVKERLCRSRDFLKKAVSLTDAKVNKKGFFVKGVSGRDYLLEKVGAKSYEVKGDDLRYICIDRTGDHIDLKDEANLNDTLAARLHVLRNDLSFASEIKTLQLES